MPEAADTEDGRPADGRKWNRNVLATFAYRCSFALSMGLWNFGNCSTYIFLLEGRSNQAVGWAQGLQGTLVALAALPAGWLADRSRRDTILRAAGVVAAAAIATMSLAIALPKHPVNLLGIATDAKFVVVLVSLALFGTTSGMSQSAVEAILGDSVPTGSRSQIYNTLFASMCMAGAFGPLISAIVFLKVGDVWDLNALGRVLLVGMALSSISAVALFLFNDDQSLGVVSEGLLSGQAVQQSSQEEHAKQEMRKHRRWGLSVAWLPYLLCASDCIAGLGSGISIKFMPLWLFEKVGLAPTAVNLVQAAVPFGIAAAALLSQRLSVSIGRVQAIVLTRLIAVAMLVFMAVCQRSWSMPAIILPIYVVRFAIGNCTYAVSKSILNDYVPKETRARWNSVESIMQFGWSGSAVLGGLIIDHSTYSVSFLATAAVQGSSILVTLFLLPLVPVREQGIFDDGVAPVVASAVQGAEEHDGPAPQAIPSKETGDMLQEPLLASSPT